MIFANTKTNKLSTMTKINLWPPRMNNKKKKKNLPYLLLVKYEKQFGVPNICQRGKKCVHVNMTQK